MSAYPTELQIVYGIKDAATLVKMRLLWSQYRPLDRGTFVFTRDPQVVAHWRLLLPALRQWAAGGAVAPATLEALRTGALWLDSGPWASEAMQGRLGPIRNEICNGCIQPGHSRTHEEREEKARTLLAKAQETDLVELLDWYQSKLPQR